MYIDIVPNKNSPPVVLLRESYREGGKVKKRTIANLAKLPMDVIDQLRILFRGGHAIESFEVSGTPRGSIGSRPCWRPRSASS
jgi:hypothetical protein